MPRDAVASPEFEEVPLPLAGGSGESDLARALAIAEPIVKNIEQFAGTDLALLALALVKMMGPRRDPDPTAIERKRRLRLRQKLNQLFTPVEARDVQVEWLIDLGYLTEEESLDRNLRGKAIVAALDDFMRSNGTPSRRP